MPLVLFSVTLDAVRAFRVVDLPATIPELLLKLSDLIVIAPPLEMMPEVIVEAEGLVFWLVTEVAFMVKSPLARISEFAELVKDAALMVKLPAEEMLLLLVKLLLRFKVRLPFD